MKTNNTGYRNTGHCNTGDYNTGDRNKTFNLPNYDRDVFIEVFGFDPERDSRKKVTLELTDEQIESLKQQGLMS